MKTKLNIILNIISVIMLSFICVITVNAESETVPQNIYINPNNISTVDDDINCAIIFEYQGKYIGYITTQKQKESTDIRLFYEVSYRAYNVKPYIYWTTSLNYSKFKRTPSETTISDVLQDFALGIYSSNDTNYPISEEYTITDIGDIYVWNNNEENIVASTAYRWTGYTGNVYEMGNIQDYQTSYIVSYATNYCTATQSSPREVAINGNIQIELVPDNGYSFYGINNPFEILQIPSAAYESVEIIDQSESFGDNIVIEITGINSDIHLAITALEYFPIIYDISNVEMDESKFFYYVNENITLGFIIPYAYTLDEISIKMDDIDITNEAYIEHANLIYIEDPYGNVNIKIHAKFSEDITQIDAIQKLKEILSALISGGDTDDKDTSDIKGNIDEYNKNESRIIQDSKNNINDALNDELPDDIVNGMVAISSVMGSFYNNSFIVMGFTILGAFIILSMVIYGKNK